MQRRERTKPEERTRRGKTYRAPRITRRVQLRKTVAGRPPVVTDGDPG
jgi:hypothetical protein